MGALRAVSNAWRKNAPELSALWNGALPEFVTARRPADTPGGVAVFCYHLVESGQLEADLQFLKDNDYQTLGADEFIDHLVAGRAVRPRSVLLTFDDGPRNFHALAFPALRRYAARALVFIAPGLHRGADDAGVNAEQQRPMTWEELREIHASGLVDLQSHTFESRFVPRWPMPAPLAGCLPAIETARRGVAMDLATDLQRSRQLLERELPGLAATHLSFPMYVGTAAAVETARAAGFRACYWGYLAGRPLNRPGESPFMISRMSEEFLRRLPGTGRIGLAQLARQRLARIQTARRWRRQFGSAD
jgi:peptidoglycan/xylan/chitin deacetylase (PgdA/CDA1 family)